MAGIKSAGAPLQQRDPIDLVGLAIFAVAGAAVYLRLFYALDFTDDAFYIGLPYAFALGHRPLVEELATHQFAGLLLLPAVKAYLGVVGSSTGLVLFARHLYFAASLASALLARDTLSAAFGSRAGNLAGALSLSYIPFLLPSLSYNSIACLGMLSGTMLLASACLPSRSPMRLGFGTACTALASFAYPPVMAAAVAALLLALIGFCSVREPELRMKAIAAVVGTGLMVGTAALAVILHYGSVADLQRLYDFSNAFGLQGGSSEKLGQIFEEVARQSRYLIALAATLIASACAIRWTRDPLLAVAAAALIGPALFVIESFYYQPWREPFTTAPFALMMLGGLAPFGLLLVRGRLTRHASMGLFVIAISSILCAGIMLWATANGLRNTALGLVPASLVALGCFSKLGPGKESHTNDFSREALIFTIFAASLLAFQVSQIWTHVYRDHPIAELDATIETGAWKGIHTTKEKKIFVKTFEQDLARRRGSAKTVMFADYFPGGYLLSDLRPRTPAIWLFPWNRAQQGNKAIREFYASSFTDEHSFPDLLVRIKCIPAHTKLPVPTRANDPLVLRLADAGYRASMKRDCYSLWTRQEP